MTNALNADDLGLRAACSRWLSSHGPTRVNDVLAALGRVTEADLPADFYGMGGAVEQLEHRSAALLGKEAATFVIKGMIAQTALLRTVTETRRGAVVIPTFGHMAIDEARAVHHLIDAEVIELGGEAGFTAEDLEGLAQPVAACVVELPVRRAAYQLLPLSELRRISDWCRKNQVHFQIDGARLWETAASYGVDLAELGALADTVYVSFYKGLGGLAGAALAGDRELLGRFQVWKKRFGGDVNTAFPFALSALDGLEKRLPRMPAYLDRARKLAAAFADRGFQTVPAVPHVNAFQVILPGEPAALMAATRGFAQRHGIWLFNAFIADGDPDRSRTEVVIGDAAEHYSDDEAVSWVEELLRQDPAVNS